MRSVRNTAAVRISFQIKLSQLLQSGAPLDAATEAMLDYQRGNGECGEDAGILG